MNKSVLNRQRRAKKTRQKIRKIGMARLSVHVSQQHIYVQLFNANGDKVITSASTLDKEIVPVLAKAGVNKDNAAIVGQYIAKRALAAGIDRVAFDRSGYKYHGRVKALADAARSEGLIF